jgi:TetR/AcrR family transcriptional regulator, transcriptional repressor for nem operon
MRYKPDHKVESRSKILAAVGRGFRKKGYAGIGVDGLAKEAEVTSGAFYGHFRSKDDAFRQALLAGMKGSRLCAKKRASIGLRRSWTFT